MRSQLTAPGSGVLRDTSEISAVGHRVVHGGERFVEAVVITDEILQELEALNPLAPLHNPINIQGIREAQHVSLVPHVATFDTAFHQTLPSYAYLYGLPYEYYEKQAVRATDSTACRTEYVSLSGVAVFETTLQRVGDRELPLGQRRFRLCRGSRSFGRHVDGLHALRGAHHGYAIGRCGSGRVCFPGTDGRADRRADR